MPPRSETSHSEPPYSMDDTILDEQLEWYYKWWVIALAIIFFGPVGLFPLWFRPRTGRRIKIYITVFVLLLSVWMTYWAVEYYREILIRYNEAFQIAE